MRNKKVTYDLRSILFMLLGIIPLLIRIQVENITESEKYIYGLNRIYTEFSYLIKVRFLFAITLIMLAIIVYDALKSHVDLRALLRKKALWFLGIYLLGGILSAVMTEFKDVALFGIYERYEGLLTYFAYGVVLVFTLLYASKERIKLFVKVLTISTIIISVIGILQYIGNDPFEWQLIKYLYLPFNMIRNMDLLRFDFKKNIAYSTLFNPNYVGTYMVLVLPVFAYYFTKVKEKAWQYLMISAFVLGIATIFAARSSAGILGLGFILLCLFLILMTDQRSVKYRKRILTAAVILIALGGIVFMGSIGEFISDILSPVRIAQGNDDRDMIKALEKNGDHFTLVFQNGLELNMQLNEKNTPIFYDRDWETLSTNYNDKKNIATFVDERYDFLALKYFKNNVVGVAVFKENYSLNSSKGYIFIKMQYLNSHIINAFGRKIDYDQDFERFEPLDGYERMGTSRGYIWSRSIPLMKGQWLWGHGPDSFGLVFPQDDVLSKANYLTDPYIIVDKPHNMYLGIAINTGILSLIGFLGFVLVTIIASIRKMRQIPIMPFLVIGVLGFLLTNMFNDSTVASMPLFYMFMGLMLKLESGEME